MPIYNGVTNVSQKISKLYAGVNDTGEKIKKVYAGVNNISELVYPTPLAYTAADVSTRYLHNLILLNTGELYFSGYNEGLTTDRTMYEKLSSLPTNSTVKQITCGSDNTFILYNNGAVYVTGDNSRGGLGLGHTTFQSYFTQCGSVPSGTVAQISAGYKFAMILMSNGALYASGRNDEGGLGIGTTSFVTTFTRVTGIPTTRTVTQVCCGHMFAMAVLDDGSLYVTGYNGNGMLGMGSGSASYYKTFTKNTTIPSGKKVELVSCDQDNAMVLLNDGTVYSAGRNQYNQMGLSNTAYKPAFTQLSIPVGTVQQIAQLQSCSMILMTDGTLYVTGDNYYGQLGLGDTTQRTTWTRVTTLPSGRKIKKLSQGTWHSMALMDDGSVYGWGYNVFGAHGFGNTTSVLLPTKAVIY
jgi:alpha-tubulin suppressor-like RCC1 family protein